jgi:hypothetical protein
MSLSGCVLFGSRNLHRIEYPTCILCTFAIAGSGGTQSVISSASLLILQPRFRSEDVVRYWAFIGQPIPESLAIQTPKPEPVLHEHVGVRTFWSTNFTC